jgi:hypothetical protein
MTMDDLRRRFESLDAVAVPDLGAEIERRVADLDRRWLAPVAVDRTNRRPAFAPLPVLLIVGVLLVSLIATVLIGAGWWLRSTVTVPSSSPPSSFSTLPSGDASPSPARSTAPRDGAIAYSVCDRRDPEDPTACDSRIWVMRFDGTAAHELRPDEPGSQFPLGWSPDGSRLLYASDSLGSNLGMTDAAGSAPELLALDSLCPDDRQSCRASAAHVAFSPDGSRLAYTIFRYSDRADPECGTDSDSLLCRLRDGTIAILDLATGQVTALEATRVPGLHQCCEGYYEPSWSADGTRLAFAMPPLSSFTIAVDGTDLRALGSPEEAFGTAPLWSPDGSRIASVICGRDPTIYVSGPDGAEIRSFSVNACDFQWTLEGRVAVSRPYIANDGDPPPSTWILDPDSGNLERVDDTVAALTAAGCMVCPLPAGEVLVNGMALWQPAAGAQP